MSQDAEKAETVASPAATTTALPESDRAFHVEQHGIDVIPDAERHGQPRELFWVWACASTIYLNFVVGGGLILLGLSLGEALGVIVVGNLWWALVGWLAVSGPASGTPSEVITRTMFGIRGNRIFGAGPNFAIGLFYEIINIAFGTLAANAILAYLGVDLGTWGKWLVLVVVAILCFLLPLYGYETIVKLAPWISLALGAAFVVLAVFVLRAADFSYHAEPVSAATKVSLILTGCAIVGASPLAWGTSADFARYLPACTPKRSVAWWTALGGFLPSVLIGGIGVAAATAIDMSDPQAAIGGIVPAWFTPVFLGLVLLTQLSGNVLTAYSTGLAVQAFGLRVSRPATIVVTGVIATVVAGWLVFITPHFLDTLNAALGLSATLLGPLVTIYAVDIVLRRNVYDGFAINDERRGSPFWYHNGFYWPGGVALITGTTFALLMVANPNLYIGPIARALGGADVSTLLGPIIGGGIYALLWLNTPPYRDPVQRPGRAGK